jgi:hypothetical protein
MGDKLANVIVNQGGDQFFNSAILEQYNLSRQLWIKLMESGARPTIQEVFSLSNYPLHASFMGYLKGKSTLLIFETDANLRYKHRNRHFGCQGYYVDTVGKNAKKI